uniref:Serpin domain-containing protein n=1 Tax=Romanomermis culicivorax TaxID=13658 RepID=A0A915JM69_ROMCU
MPSNFQSTCGLAVSPKMSFYNTKACKEAVELVEKKWKNVDLNDQQFELAQPQSIEFQSFKLADFSYDLWLNTEPEGFSTSRIISPAPLILCLSNLHFIADGDTRQHLTKILGFPGDEREQLKSHQWLVYAYSRLCDQPRPSKVRPVQKVIIRGYEPSAMDQNLQNAYDRYAVDLKCLHSEPYFDTIDQTIDHLVSKQSSGKMKSLLPSGCTFDKTVDLAIMTSIYFEPEWMNLCPLGLATLCDFDVQNAAGLAKVFKLPSIKSTVRADYGEFSECIISGYEFKWSSLTIYFFKPNNNLTLPEMEKALTGSKLISYIREVAKRRFFKKYDVDTQIPLFTLENHVELKPALEKMGLKNLCDQEECNLYRLCPKRNKNYALSMAFQHVAIKIGLRSGNFRHLIKEPKKIIPDYVPTRKQFHLDSAFLFVVYEFNTGLILFIGRVIDPTASYVGGEQLL